MLNHQPMTRCFMTLCFGAAVLVVAAEWQAYPNRRDAHILPEPARMASIWVNHVAQAAEIPLASAADQKLIVSLSGRNVTLYVEGDIVAKYDIAIGQEEWQTPTGEFAVMDKRKNPAWQHPITGQVILAGAENPLGSRWIGFWTDGQYFIGFHGTNQEDLIGQAVSHGCIRMRNRDIEALYDQIAMGVPVIVNP